MPPWRVTSVYFKAHSVLELPAGTLAGSQTQEGDRLVFEPSDPGRRANGLPSEAWPARDDRFCPPGPLC